MNDADRLLRQTAKEEPGALAQLIEVTGEDAYRYVGGDADALLKVYRTMLGHLSEVHPRIRFWDWFGQIAGTRSSAEMTGPLPSELRQALVSLPIAPERASNALGDRLARLYQNGWLPAFGAGFGVGMSLITLERRSGGFLPGDILLALLIAAAGASLASLTLGPWLGGWRRFPRPLVAGLAFAILASAGAFCAAILMLALQCSLNPGTPTERAAVQLIADLGWSQLAAGLFLGAALEMVGRRSLASRRWMLYRGGSVARQTFAKVLLSIPVLSFLFQVLPVLWGGWSFRPEILEMQVERTGSSYFQDRYRPQPPSEYLDDPSIRALSTGRTGGHGTREVLQSLACQTWIREAVKLWTPQELESDGALAALCFSASQLQLADPNVTKQLSADQLEVLVRQGLVLNCRVSREVILASIESVRAPAARWQKLAEASLACEAVLKAPKVDEGTLGVFADRARAIEAKDRLWILHQSTWPWWVRLKARKDLNERWDIMEAERLTPSDHPWTPQRERRLAGAYRASTDLSDGWTPASQGLREFRQRRLMAALAICLQVKSAAVSGATIPDDLSALGPHGQKIATAYEGWFELERTQNGATLRLLDAAGKVDDEWVITRD